MKYKIIDNFFPTTLIKNVKKELESNSFSIEKIMGGRYRIANNEDVFYKFINKNLYSKKLYNYLNTKFFFNFLIDNFIDYLPYKITKKKFLFSKDFSKRNPKYYEKLINKKINFFLKVINTFFLQLYLYLDFSIGTKNYTREIHYDNKDRLIVFLIFLNNFSLNEGGQFKIYNNQRKLIKSITPKQNRLVLFIADNNALHNVSKISSNNKRYFIYGAITANKLMRDKL